jgi:RNA polymerase sigma factor (sigma-70 family)
MASALAAKSGKHGIKVHADESPDEYLLRQFLNGTESESQDAFGTLVERHGPMVLGVCRHVLHGHHDAEDAFQATFLVLARKAGSIRNGRVLAGWLHEVAHRIAIKARASAARRRTLEREGVAMSPAAFESNTQDEAAAWKELRPVLHAEVEMLPDRYRIPVILSYLEGKTNEEVAKLLRWPVGTVKGRLSRARDLLRRRLLRRGLALSAAFLMTALSHGTVFAEVVPSELVRRTVRLAAKHGARAASSVAAGSEPPDALAPSPSQPAGGTSKLKVARTSISRRALGGIFVTIAAFLISSGLLMAALGSGRSSEFRAAISKLGSGGSSELQAAISKLVPARAVAGAGCH